MKPGMGVMMVRVSFFFNMMTVCYGAVSGCVFQLQGTMLAATIGKAPKYSVSAQHPESSYQS